MKPRASRQMLLTAALSSAIGLVLGGLGGTAWACGERGNNLKESWTLELVTAEIEGEPFVAPVLVIGSGAELYRHGKKRNEVVLTNPSMRFSKVSE
jgi:hypothetical protein